MAEGFAVFVEGLKDIPSAQDMHEARRRAARIATNDTATWARTRSQREIEKQVAFPTGYPNPAGGRLAVRTRASDSDLEAIVTGRGRPTSLARFARGTLTPGKRDGVTVEVAPGRARYARRMFAIRLRAGNADLETKSNLGLAIRLKPGETLTGKRFAVKMNNGLYLLYGPSVDQVFDDVAGMIAPDAAEHMAAEFLRIVDLKL